jgi:transcriptional regulator with XRE-family HTH domain
MRLRSPELLAEYMRIGDFSQARLARYAGCSRQFIYLLLKGERRTCTPEIAKLIEEAMRVLPGTLFDRSESPVGRRDVVKTGRVA